MYRLTNQTIAINGETLSKTKTVRVYKNKNIIKHQGQEIDVTQNEETDIWFPKSELKIDWTKKLDQESFLRLRHGTADEGKIIKKYLTYVETLEEAEGYLDNELDIWGDYIEGRYNLTEGDLFNLEHANWSDIFYI